MRKRIRYMLLFLVAMSLFVSCNKQDTSVNTTDAVSGVREAADFRGKRIAIVTGSLTENSTLALGAIPVYYNDSTSGAEDVRLGRVSGMMHTYSSTQIMAEELGKDKFEVIFVPKEIFDSQVGAISHDRAIVDSFNAFLEIFKADGSLAALQELWFAETRDMNRVVPDIPNSGKNGVLKVAICSDVPPYVFIGKNGKPSGLSVELALHFGAFEEKTVEFIDMDFGALIPYIMSKKADLSMSSMAITEERKQSVMFTDPFCEDWHGILTLRGK